MVRGRIELALGGRVFVEGCSMRGSDITYSGKVGFDVLSNEYKMTDYQFSRPYISPQQPDKQLDDRQRTALLSPEGLDCSKEKGTSHSGQEWQGAELYPAYRPPLERRGL